MEIYIPDNLLTTDFVYFVYFVYKATSSFTKHGHYT
jgi:hypothetical protein